MAEQPFVTLFDIVSVRTTWPSAAAAAPIGRPTALLALWWAMYDAAVAGGGKPFRTAQEDFNRLYKRSDYREQGEYHHLLASGVVVRNVPHA